MKSVKEIKYILRDEGICEEQIIRILEKMFPEKSVLDLMDIYLGTMYTGGTLFYIGDEDQQKQLCESYYRQKCFATQKDV